MEAHVARKLSDKVNSLTDDRKAVMKKVLNKIYSSTFNGEYSVYLLFLFREEPDWLISELEDLDYKVSIVPHNELQGSQWYSISINWDV